MSNLIRFSGNWWNTPNCYDAEHLNTTKIDGAVRDTVVGDGGGETTLASQYAKHNNSKSPVEEYWE